LWISLAARKSFEEGTGVYDCSASCTVLASIFGGLTILSTVVLYRLKSGDGSNVSRQTDLHMG
jgi:hypothetical protein